MVKNSKIFIGVRMGSEAVIALLRGQSDTEPIVIGIHGNQTVYLPLVESVEKTMSVNRSLKEGNFKRAVELRGESYLRNLITYIKMSKLEPKISTNLLCKQYTLGILNLGAPAGGVNSAIRSFVRKGISLGCKMLAVQDGFEGLVKGQIKELDWRTVYGWTGVGGSILGCQRIDAKTVGYREIAEKIRQYEIDGIVLIGGFEAYTSVIQLNEERKNFTEFCMPMICIPATISNNIPGSDFSIGCDTALNEIVSVITF